MEIVWSIIWVLILWFIGWPIGSFCSGFYLLLSPCVHCCDFLKPIVDILEKGVKIPYLCGRNCALGRGWDFDGI